MPFHEDRSICFKKAIQYYSKELNLLTTNTELNHTRIALNQITTAMLYKAFNPSANPTRFYELALKELIVANDSSILITRNPIYSSIALTQYARLFSDFKGRLDSLSDLNKLYFPSLQRKI